MQLKWHGDELKIGQLYVGEIMYHYDLKERPWSAWFSSSVPQELIGLFTKRDEAAKAVETRTNEALAS